MRKIVRILVGIVIVGIAVASVRIALNPLRRSSEKIAAWLEVQTPIGSSYSDVIDLVKKKNWYDARVQIADNEMHGKYIRGELGDYQGLPFVISVSAIWEFDSTSRLQHIRILRTSDAL